MRSTRVAAKQWLWRAASDQPARRPSARESHWREARRSVLPPDALTGHTLDDQAETILLNLLRGSSLDGLAGITPGPTKPLLKIRRTETRALCRALGLTPVEDPSNVDPAFRRARIRRDPC